MTRLNTGVLKFLLETMLVIPSLNLVILYRWSWLILKGKVSGQKTSPVLASTTISKVVVRNVTPGSDRVHVPDRKAVHHGFLFHRHLRGSETVEIQSDLAETSRPLSPCYRDRVFGKFVSEWRNESNLDQKVSCIASLKLLNLTAILNFWLRLWSNLWYENGWEIMERLLTGLSWRIIGRNNLYDCKERWKILFSPWFSCFVLCLTVVTELRLLRHAFSRVT